MKRIVSERQDKSNEMHTISIIIDVINERRSGAAYLSQHCLHRVSGCWAYFVMNQQMINAADGENGYTQRTKVR